MADEPVVVIPVSEILQGINEGIADLKARDEHQTRRMDQIETRVNAIEKVVLDDLPKIRKFMEESNVQKQVEDALDSRRMNGVSRRDKIIVGSLSACILAVTLFSGIHGFFR